jgi:hypothetical protein
VELSDEERRRLEQEQMQYTMEEPQEY